MSVSVESVLDMVSRHVGDQVSSVERVLYEFEGELQEEGGEVQIRFGHELVRFRCAAAGELIEVAETHWEDPFEGRMTPENVEFVRTHGRWRLVNVSERPNYQELIGKRLTKVLPLTNRFGNPIGVQMHINGTAINIFVHADEVHVSWGHDRAPRWGHEWVDQ